MIQALASNLNQIEEKEELERNYQDQIRNYQDRIKELDELHQVVESAMAQVQEELSRSQSLNQGYQNEIIHLREKLI